MLSKKKLLQNIKNHNLTVSFLEGLGERGGCTGRTITPLEAKADRISGKRVV